MLIIGAHSQRNIRVSKYREVAIWLGHDCCTLDILLVAISDVHRWFSGRPK
jgi:hypothetical protein